MKRLFEAGVLTRHAATVWVGQLAIMGFGLADTLIAGRHSDASLAALSVGSAVYISVYVALLGLLQAQLPIWAEMRGAGQTSALGASVRQGVWLMLLATLLGWFGLWLAPTLLAWTDVPANMRPMVGDYLEVVAVGLLPTLAFRLFSTLNQALGKPKLVTWVQAGALCLKLPLSWWFAFGGFGVPAGGAVGCAWATVLVTIAMVILALILLRTQPLYQPFGLWRRLERPDGKQLREFARLGVPNSLAVLIEVTSFTLMALFVARLGTQAAAAHQIASNLAAMLYMLPLAAGIATSARVSFWRGARDEGRARAALLTGMQLTLAAASVTALAVAVLHRELAHLYASTPETAAAAAVLILWVAAYHLPDAVQAMCMFVLRSYRITIAPMVIYTVLLWGLGLVGGYVLAYRGVGSVPPLHSAGAFWMASTVALALTAVLFVLLLWHATRSIQSAASPNAAP